ncbi:hypothetical protein LIA77_03442 [Sarocladium implicatum]|nr:hypothetical protein LIA77_03442 [Sarocladium implicatum]
MYVRVYPNFPLSRSREIPSQCSQVALSFTTWAVVPTTQPASRSLLRDPSDDESHLESTAVTQLLHKSEHGRPGQATCDASASIRRSQRTKVGKRCHLTRSGDMPLQALSPLGFARTASPT